MIYRDRSFPHPVLSSLRDDVIPNRFDHTLTVSSDSDSFFLAHSLSFDNPTLTDLLESGGAQVLAHVECKRNFFRERFALDAAGGRIQLSAQDLVGQVEVTVFIVARVQIDGYKISGAHADYADQEFSVREGEILAAAPTSVFDAFVEYDPLKKISSIITILKSEELEDGAFEVNRLAEKIEVTLSKRDYERYTDLKSDPQIAALLANQVVVPVLVEAVDEIANTTDEDLDDAKSRLWFRSVLRKLDELEIDVRGGAKTSLSAVQELLKLPLRRSLLGIERLSPLEAEQ